MENDRGFNSVKHIFEQMYLCILQWCDAVQVTAGLHWESPVFLQFFRIVSVVQEKMLIVTTRMFRAVFISFAPVCCKSSECVQKHSLWNAP